MTTPLAAWAQFWQELTPEALERLGAIAAPDIRFQDPFHDITGVASLTALLQQMFGTLSSPQFVVDDMAMGEQGYLRWHFTARRNGRLMTIEGTSVVWFNADGLVIRHQDHWDAATQFYEQLPLLGGVLRWIKRQVRHHGEPPAAR